MSKATFDGYVASSDGYYPAQVLDSGERIMVLVDEQDGYNREYCSIALFAKNGLVSSLGWNKFGPPVVSLPINRITLPVLFRHVPRSCCPECHKSWFCQFPGANCCAYIFGFWPFIPSPFVSPIRGPTQGF